MATINLQTTGNLIGLVFTQANSDADIAAVDGRIVDDSQMTNRYPGSPGGATIGGGIVFTGTLTSSNLGGMTSVNVTGLTGSTITSIQPGQWIYGPNIPAGTKVLTVSGTSPNGVITFSANHTVSAGPTAITAFTVGTKVTGSFSKNGQLIVPGRGSLQIFPGDAVFVDRSGWPILVSKQALAYSNSSWVQS